MSQSSSTSDYLALDLGAESGRGILGRFDGRKLTLDEVHRFPNGPVRMLDTIHWDVPHLFGEMKNALGKAAAASGAGLEGVGIDTWGVDFGLVGRGDTLLGNPVHYRDARTDGMAEIAARKLSRERIYEITGLQYLPFNSIYQLLALRTANSPLLDVAETLLMMPDLFAWLLTGRRAGERTDASTTQLLDPRTGTWSAEICFRPLDLPHSILPTLIEPGTEIGPIRGSVIEEVGLKRGARPCSRPARTDTCCAAVAAVRRGPQTWHQGVATGLGVISAPETWSLLGVESAAPGDHCTETFKYNFTNEGGVAGTTRLLKNIMGLWLVQEHARTWSRAGVEWSCV